MRDGGIPPRVPGFAEALGMYLLLFCYALFAGRLFHLVFGRLFLIPFTTGLAAIPLLYAWFRGLSIRETFSFRVPAPRKLGGGLLLCLGLFLLVYIASGIAGFIFPEAGKEGALRDIAVAGIPVWYGLLVIVALPAICEELLFRGFVQSGLAGVAGRTWTLLVSGTLFGLMHADPLRLPFTVAVGVALAFALRESRSVWVPLVMHGTYNLLLYMLIRLSAAAGSGHTGVKSLARDALASFGAGAGPNSAVPAAVLVVISFAAGCGILFVLLGCGLLRSSAQTGLRRRG